MEDNSLENNEYKAKEERIKREVGSLKIRYNLIKGVFKEAEEKWEITHEPARQWLYRLKLYSSEVENLYEEYDYEIFRRNIKQDADHIKKNKVCN